MNFDNLKANALSTKNANITSEDLREQGYWFERLNKINNTTGTKENSYISFNTKFWDYVNSNGGRLSIANADGKSYILIGSEDNLPCHSRRSFFRNMTLVLDEALEVSNYYRLLATEDSTVFEIERMEPRDMSTRGTGNTAAL